MTALRRATGRTQPVRQPRRLRAFLIGTLVSAVLLLFAAVVWFAYQELMPGGDGAPPLIRADARPLKHEPEERGGLSVVNAESVIVQALEEPDSSVRVERIVPRDPAPPRTAADVIPEALEAEEEDIQALMVPDGEDAASLDALIGEVVEESTLDGTEASEAAGASGGEPTLGATAATTPAETEAEQPAAAEEPAESVVAALPEALVTTDRPALASPPAAVSVPATANAPADAPAAQPVARPAPPAAQLAAVPPAAVPPPAATPRQPAAATPPPATPPPATPPAAAQQPALALSFAGAYRIQLLASRDEAAAAGAWNGLQQRHPSELGRLQRQLQQAEVGGNTFYRLQAGPFANRAGAIATCEALKAKGADCFVVEPAS